MTANLIEKGLGLATRTTKRFARTGADALNMAGGLVAKTRGGGAAPQASPLPKDLDDVTIARKVESTIFRGRSTLKGSVDVNVAHGVVELRGTVKRPEQVRALEAAARAVPEVKDVENLLVTKGTPSPTRASTPKRQQKQTTRASAARPRKGTRVTDDRTSDIAPDAENAPGSGQGRTAAPLGSQGEEQDTASGDTLPSGEAPLGERPPAMEGEPLKEPKTEDGGTPVTPSGGRSGQST